MHLKFSLLPASLLPASLLLCTVLFACSTPQAANPITPGSNTNTTTGTAGTVAFAQIQSIFEQRCNGCHSNSPTFTGFSPPAGSRDYTVPANIKADISKIRRETVTGQGMPERNNITQMTAAERQLLGQWISEGANLN
ncbi:MAG: hypothetical protein IV090_16550 [Candidatus Sericytochromatia bacterium]|nr:hypothetical protein [Candidatus Sericytochromatia bacterium]